LIECVNLPDTRVIDPVRFDAKLEQKIEKAAIMIPELQSPVPSPCINVCEMEPDTGLCRGCMRTLAEIAAWGRANDDYKRAVWAEIRRREAQPEFR